MFGILLFALVLSAWFFFAWGLVKATLAGSEKYAKDRIFMIKTFWVLFFGSAQWLALGLLRYCMELPSWGYFVFFIVLAWEAYAFNKKIKTMPRKSEE